MDGPFADWNKANPDIAVQAGDLIVAVNGMACSAAESVEALKTSAPMGTRRLQHFNLSVGCFYNKYVNLLGFLIICMLSLLDLN